MAKYNDRGQEVPDDMPIAVPLNWRRPPSLPELIRAFVRKELVEGEVKDETIADAEDVDIDEEDEELSQYQRAFAIHEKISRNVESKVVDRDAGKRDNGRTAEVKPDIKESKDVHAKPVGVDGKGVGSDGKERPASGG